MEKVVETIYFVRYNIFCFFVWNGRSNFFFSGAVNQNKNEQTKSTVYAAILEEC